VGRDLGPHRRGEQPRDLPQGRVGLETGRLAQCGRGATMEHRPCRLGHQDEGSPNNGLLRSIHQPGIVNEADTTADVIHGVAGECTPRGDSEREAGGGPNVYSDRADSI